MIIDELITNRLQSNVARLALLSEKGWQNLTNDEKVEYNTSVGAYTATDINRVSEAQEYIADTFNDFPPVLQARYLAAIAEIMASLTYPSAYYVLDDPLLPEELGEVSYDEVVLQPVKTNWTDSDIQQAVVPIGYYLANVGTLKNVLQVSTANVPTSLNGLTATTANDIEKILLDVYNNAQTYFSRKISALDGEKEQQEYKYSLQEAQWLTSGEFYSGEF